MALVSYFGYIHTKKHSNTLVLYGNVDIREVNLSFRIPGLIKSMLLEEGSLVKMGQSIAYLDKDQYIDQLNEAHALVNAYAAELNKLLAGTRSEDITQAKALVQEREVALGNAKLLFARNRQGHKSGVVSKQEYDNSIKQKDAAEAMLLAAKSSWLKAINGPRKEDIQAGWANLQAAKARAARLEKTIVYTTLISPNDGVILTRIKEPGTYIASGEPVYTVAINSPKWVQAYVDETNLGKLQPGLAVQITTDSYPNKIYTGIVGFISPTAEFTPKTVETPELRSSLVYRIRIVTVDPQNQLRQGMPVTIKINLGPGHDAQTTSNNK